MYRRFKICCGFVLLSLAAGLAASCAPDSGPVDSGTRTGSIVAQVVWPEAVGTLATFSPNGVTPLDTPPGIFTVRALVTGPGMADLQQDFPTMPGDSGPAASGTITDIPAGSNRTLTLEGLNGLGVATYRGQVSGITVDPGQITDAGMIILLPVGATLVSMEVSPPLPSIANGTTQQFTATGIYSDDSTLDLTDSATWDSTFPAFATISNASGSEGLATGLLAGSTTISAMFGIVSSDDSLESASLTVTAATLLSIAVTPTSPTIAAGTTVQFTAIGTFSDSSTPDLTDTVTWSSDDPSATVDSVGLATAVSAGSATITATFGVSGSTLLTVSAATLISIAVTPLAPSIANGSTEQFTATGTYSDSSTQDLTDSVIWGSSDTAVALISNTTGSEGLATSTGVGSAIIAAASGAISGSTTLTVTAATLTSIAVTPATPTIATGTTQQFTATGTYSDASTQDLTDTVTWDSTFPAFATISNASGSEGLATGVSAGSTTISATFGGVSSDTSAESASLTVTAALLSSIAVTPTSPTIATGTTQQFTATGDFSGLFTQDLTDSVNWSSNDTAVATISNASGSEGLATGVSAGSTTISATFAAVSSNDTGESSSLTVSAATLVSIAVTAPTPFVRPTDTLQHTATGTFSDFSTQDLTSAVTWSSSDTGVAVVGNDAATKGLATGIADGVVTVAAVHPPSGISSDDTGQSATLTVTSTVLTLVTPADGSIIKVVDPIVILFSESMDTATLIPLIPLGGTLGAESDGGVWSTTNNVDDTLTVSPAATWSIAAGRTLTVDVLSVSGNPFAVLSLTYDVAVVHVNQADPSASDANPGTQALPFLTIQAAIDGAVTLGLNPAEVHVAAATYSVDSSMSTHILLSDGRSLMGGYAIDWSGRDPDVNVTTIQDMAISGGTAADPNRAIEADSTIQAATVVDGFAIMGGGGVYSSAVFVNQGSPTLSDNAIDGGSGTTWSVGIFAAGVSGTPIEPAIIGNTIDGGTGGTNSYGIFDTFSESLIYNNVIDGGTGGTNSYGIYITRSEAKVRNNTIDGGSGGSESNGIVHDGTGGISESVAENNIVFTTGGTSRYCLVEFEATNSDFKSVKNNDLWDCPTAFYRDQGTTNVQDLDTTSISTGVGTNTLESFGNISEPPMFVGGGDFHLTDPGSPINVREGGLDQSMLAKGAFSADKDGVTRTAGVTSATNVGAAGWSMGAYERD